MRRLGILLSFLCFAIAPAIAADSPSQRFVVFFQEWSAKLDEPATTVIERAAAYARDHARDIVHVAGFADPTGSRAANALLSDLRAQVVIDQLQAHGVRPARIIGRGRGPVHYALTAQESRRVEISFGGR